METKKVFLKNLFYLIKILWQYNHRIFVLFMSIVIFSSIVPLIEIWIPKVLLEGIIKDRDIREMIILLSFLAFGVWGLNIWVGYLQKEYNRMISVARTDCFGDLLMNKTYQMRYYLLEDPKIQQLFEKARMVSFSDKEGVEGILRNLQLILSKGLTIIGLGVIIAQLSPLIVILLVIGVSSNIWILNKVKNKELLMRDENTAYDRKLNYYQDKMSDFSYGKDIRLYQLTEWISNKHKEAASGRLVNQKKISNAYFSIDLFRGMYILVQESLIYSFLIYEVVIKGMGIDDFSLYFGAIASFSTVLIGIITSGTSIIQFSKCISDMRLLMEMENELGGKYTDKIKGEIIFDKVEFKYPGCDKTIYKDFNLCIKAGEKVAIVGKNGAGKTTLTKLLVGLHKCDSGRILIDGKDTREIESKTLYSFFSVVFQQINQYAFSLKENIAFQEQGSIETNKLKNVIDESGLVKVVEGLQNGIETSLRKDFDPSGVDLSGGQAQKLALARALYKDAPILILDEPTAAMDALAEAKLYEQFNHLVGDKTAIYISHRLSSTRFCDKVVLVDEGHVVEYGTHKELMDLRGIYWEMFNAQRYYYQEKIVEEEIAVGEV
ncbi:MAG: ABC transporter ATP-binding protein [Niameybacter sp.]